MNIYEEIIKANSVDKQMTVLETANYLNLSPQTIRKRIKEGTIKATPLGKEVRILKAQFIN